jgi:hypothetical protein
MNLVFLLEQGGKILGGASKPTKLPFDRLDKSASWTILAGLEEPVWTGIGTELSRYDSRRILGSTVKFTAKPGAKFFRITSRLDDYARLVNHSGDSVELLFDRIRVQEDSGEYDDHAALMLTEAWECEQ